MIKRKEVVKMEEGKNIGPLRDSQLMKPMKEIPGLENFPDSSVMIPRLIVGQPSNISGWEPGKFSNNLTFETYDELNVVLLKMQRTRTLWPSDRPKAGDLPSCRSSDAKVADLDFYGKLCSRCDDVHQQCVTTEDNKETPLCGHSKFKRDDRPDCRLAYHLLLASIDTQDVFILSLTGKGISRTNRLISSFKVKGRAPYSAQFKISLEKAGDGEYFMIKYSDFKWFESADELQELFENFKDRPLTPIQEEEHSNGD